MKWVPSPIWEINYRDKCLPYEGISSNCVLWNSLPVDVNNCSEIKWEAKRDSGEKLRWGKLGERKLKRLLSGRRLGSLDANSGQNIEERAQDDFGQQQLLSFQMDVRHLQGVSLFCIYIFFCVWKTKATALLKIFLDEILDTFPDHLIANQGLEGNKTKPTPLNSN